MSDLTLAGYRCAAGRKHVVRIPVTRDLTGEVEIVAHAVTGAGDGPTLLLLSMLHGNEWFSAVILRELVARLDPAVMHGNVIAIPVANTPAMATRSRCILDDSDEPDANRTFGGPYGWLTNQIARVLADECFTVSDAIIDYHVGDWGATMADVSYVTDFSKPGVSERSRALARAYGFPVLHALTIHTGLRGPRTSLGYAGETRGIPGIVAEVGGLGWGEPQESAWVEQNIAGTTGVMRELGILPGTPARATRFLEVHDYWRVGPTRGGYMIPAAGLDRQFTEVAPGEVLARVYEARTFELLEELKAPGRGVIFYACRAHMVRPGGWAFGVANLEDGKTRWIDE